MFPDLTFYKMLSKILIIMDLAKLYICSRKLQYLAKYIPYIR